MSTTLFYFSSTGNSLKIARDIASGIADCSVVSLADPGNHQCTAETIGIIFPVYMFGIPRIVADFLKTYNFGSPRYIFTVANCGGMAGAAIIQIESLLQTRGLKLSAGFRVVMPGNYTPFYGAKPMEKQQKIFNKAAQKTAQIITIIQNKENHIERGFVFINKLFEKALYEKGMKEVPRMDTRFIIDNNCTSCGVCVQVCPKANIKMENNHPEFLHNCEHCLACLQWCPAEAIQFGNITRGRKRYHHPEIKIQDIIDSAMKHQ